MNLRLVLLGAIAIFASYLVFSITPVSAVNVKIYYNDDNALNPPQSTAQYNPQSYLKKEVAVEAGNVRINITGLNGGLVEKVYVYTCKGLSPSACASSAAANVSDGPFSATYPWSSVADQAGQKAGFLILVKVRVSDKLFWTGFWQWIERADSSTFTPYESQIGDIRVHAKEIEDVAAIKNFITNNRMIPFNPNWVTKIVFPAASGLYLIKSGAQEIENQLLTPSQVSPNLLTGTDKDYTFAFPNISGIPFSPVALNLNPSYTCGSSGCESSLGESQANCCLDCTCQSGYYCDLGGMCKQSAGISLSIYGTPVTAVSNCNQQHTLNISVRVNSPPTGMGIASTRFKLGSNPYQTTTCVQGSGYIFSCPVSVPAVPGCQAGSYNLGPNYINFSISYPDGRSTASRSMAVQFPNVTIGSYSCGNRICEPSLGESESNCCYDCFCPAGYCDLPGLPETGACKSDPSGSSLLISSVNPAQFYTHQPGDAAGFSAKIAGSPASLQVSGQSCAISCARGDGQQCSAACSVSCSKAGSSDPSVYNSTCTMGFSIASYDPQKRYSLFPTLNLSVSYTNGSQGSVQKTLSSSVPTISIGSHWCGDSVCNPDESALSCCYDCPCGYDYYCDTQDSQYHSQGDSCQENPQLFQESVSTTLFTDTYEQHIINFTGYVNARPGGVSIAPDCSFNGSSSGIPCYVECGESASSNAQAYRFLCQVIVPPIDYNTSAFFNPVTRKVALDSNTLNLTLSYNNGSKKAEEEYSFSIPGIEINVVPKCGNEICERNVGESGQECCYDCGCKTEYGSGHFCYSGRSLDGECLSVTAINMRIREVQPNPVNCTIFEKGRQCAFSQSMKLYAEILNPPQDMEIAEAYYRVSAGGVYSNYSALNCYRLEGQGNYSCSFVLEKSSSTAPGREVRKLDLSMSLAYTLNDVTVFRNVSDEGFEITVTRAYSQALASCIEHQKRIDKQLAQLENDRRTYTSIMIIFIVTAAALWAAYWISCEHGCNEYLRRMAMVAGWIASCSVAFFLLPQLKEIKEKMEKLKSEKDAACTSSTFSGLSASTSSTGNVLYDLGTIIAAIACAMSTVGVINLFSGATTAAGTGTTGTEGGEYMGTSEQFYKSVPVTTA